MKNFISEDDIEQAILKKLSDKAFDYDIILCDSNPDKREILPDGTGRTNKRECVLPEILRESLLRINPTIAEEKIDEVVRLLCANFTGTDIVATNYDLYNKIRNGIQVKIKKNGKEDFDFVKFVDFTNAANNTFTAVSQMWIQGQ